MEENVQNNNPPSNKAEIDSLKEQVIKFEKEKEDYLNGWKRAKADYINLQKDEARRMEEIIKFANSELIKELLVVLDSLNLSIIATKDPEAKKGIEIIHSQLEQVLEKQGLERIKALGEKFDPAIHEAMLQEESEKESGSVLGEIVSGWKLNEKIIRPTKVKVSK